VKEQPKVGWTGTCRGKGADLVRRLRFWSLLFAALAFLLILVTGAPAPVARASLAKHVFLPLVVAAVLPPATPTPVSCPGPQQALINHGFESGFLGWTVVLGTPFISSDHTSDGGYSLGLGGHNASHDFVEQTVTVPTWTQSAALYFYSVMYSSDSPTVRHDSLVVQVTAQNGAILASKVIWNTDPRGLWFSWKLPMSNVAPYRGQPMMVGISDTTDSASPTTWYVDDFGLVFSCGGLPLP
jgi:hypothetical protein